MRTHRCLRAEPADHRPTQEPERWPAETYVPRCQRALPGRQGRRRRARRPSIQSTAVDRIIKHVREALDGFPVLEKLRREDARQVRDFLAGQRKKNGELLSSASVQRELTIIKAIVNHGMREFDVRGDVMDPFNDLRIGGANVTG